jgi:hypothetical protein
VSAVTVYSTGFTSRWGSACIPRVFTPVEAVSPPKEEVGGTEVLACDNNGIVRRAESSRQTTLRLGVVDVSPLTCLYPARIMRSIPLDDL